jgi:hypothetical protein
MVEFIWASGPNTACLDICHVSFAICHRTGGAPSSHRRRGVPLEAVPSGRIAKMPAEFRTIRNQMG